MKIAEKHVVRFHYTLKNTADQTLESSDKDQPIAYLFGHNNIIPGLEKAMLGKTAGEQFSVTIPPEEAYGPRTENATQRVSIKHLQGAKKWKPGMVAIIDTDQGRRQATVVKIGKFMADVDFNHPLAGKTLKFDVEIVEVREATQEELEHGHAHGDGGHQH